MNAETRFESEARWLAEFRSEEHYLLKQAALLEEIGASGEAERRRADLMREFRENVQGALPDHVRVPKAVPNMRAMLRDVDEERKYLFYLRLSQFTHANHTSIGVYRQDDPEGLRLLEKVEAREWRWVFRAAWPAFSQAARVVFEKGFGLPAPIHPDIEAEFDQATDAVS